MIISHDRKTLFIGVPKNGSQTARAVLGPLGIDLVGEMGRHPTVPEAIRLAEARFPGEVIAPTAIYAFWRDPVERFCSAIEFHKRCLPNSFIQLFPERFEGIEPHQRWFETNAEAVEPQLRMAVTDIAPIEVISALPVLPIVEKHFQSRGGNLSFYRPQAHWLGHPSISILAFGTYERELRGLVDVFGGYGETTYLPNLNRAVEDLCVLDAQSINYVSALYGQDTGLAQRIL